MRAISKTSAAEETKRASMFSRIHAGSSSQSTLLASGRIITRSSHERELGLANKRGDEWKETALDTRKVNGMLLHMNSKLVESSKISDHFFRTLNPDKYPKGDDQ